MEFRLMSWLKITRKGDKVEEKASSAALWRNRTKFLWKKEIRICPKM